MTNNHKNTSVTKTSIFGVLAGFSFIAVSLFFYQSGKNINLNPQLNNALTLLTIAGVFVGVRKYREDHLNGIISYGKTLGACVYLIAVASLVYGVYIYFIYTYKPELKENYIEMMQPIWTAVYSGALLESVQNIAETAINAGVIAFSEIVKNIITGFLFSLFLAGILKRKEEAKKIDV